MLSVVGSFISSHRECAGYEQEDPRAGHQAGRIRKAHDELTREQTSLERANAELRSQLKEHRKAHQGMTDLTRKLASLAMIVYSETCSSPQKLRNS
jgi:hypothetical protein